MRQITANRRGGNGVSKGMTSFALERAVTRVGAAPVDRAEAQVHEVYLAHFGQLAGWAAHLVGDRDLGHDLATDAFIRLLDNWDHVTRPRPWLYTTVANLVKDHWRKRGRERAAYERFQGGHDPDVAVATHTDAATTLTVRAAVESLPERLRLAVLLHYFADLTVTEVARQLGKAEGTIKRDLHEARRRLATTLESAR